MSKPIRIGFVGVGGIVKSRHAPNLQNIEDVQLVSVCNRSAESSERAAQEIGAYKVFDDWRELAQDRDIDAVWIGTWPYMHCPVTLAALQAGKHVFCQARMAMNLAEAKQMLEAARQSGLVTMLCPPPMGMKGDFVMQDLVKSGELGEITSLYFHEHSDLYLDPNSPISWRQRSDLSGLNTLTVGIYAEVIHRWFGYTKSICAKAKTFITERPTYDGDTMPVTRPDVVLALCEMESGALMRWEWNSLTHMKKDSCVEAHGDKGAVVYNFQTDEIFLIQAGNIVDMIEIPPEKERHWTVERDFIDAIRNGGDTHPNFYDGMKYMEFTEALFRSVEEERVVCLPLD